MFAGKKVKIRLKRLAPEQKMRVFIGKVLDMNDYWLKIEGKFYTLAKGERRPRVDDQPRVLGIPRESVYLIRQLPDSVDLANFRYTIKDNRLLISLEERRQPVSISEY